MKNNISRRHFIKKSGLTTGILGTAFLKGTIETQSDPIEGLISEKGFSVIGPYPHMWQSDDQAPYVEQIGLGLAALKVVGDHSISIPIWPAFLALAKEKDPIRSVWKPHAFSPIEPQTPPEDDLEIFSREWLPHVLSSVLKWKGVAIRQEIVTLKNSVLGKLQFEKGVSDFYLFGESSGPAYIDIHEGGIVVNENHHKAKTVSYQVEFDPKPSHIKIIGGEKKMIWKYQWEMDINELEITVKIGNVPSASFMPTNIQVPSFNIALEEQEKSWAVYFNKGVVRVATPDERINKLIDYLAWVYRSNGLFNGGLLNHRFNMPKQTFAQFWMWDCCFNGIAGMWYGDRELVWGNLNNIPNMQVPSGMSSAGCVPNAGNRYGINMWETEDAMSGRVTILPHLVDRLKIMGDGSHPPIYAQALEKVWKTEGRKFARPGLLESAIAYNEWWERTRASTRFPGLLLVRRWSDSGMDNSKRWGHQGSGIYNTKLEQNEWSMPIVTVDLNVYSVLEKRAIANMLEHQGEIERAIQFREEADQRVKLVHCHLWSDEARYYLDYAEDQDIFVPVISPTGAYPLLIEGLTPEREEGIYKYLMDPRHFFTLAPIPSLSVSDPDFKPEQSYWMGPSWMCYTIYILRGMFRTRPEAGWKVFNNLLDTLIQDGTPYIFENYNPLTRQYYDCQGFHWQGMFVDLILEEVLGLKIKDNRLVIDQARTPEGWDSVKIKNVYYQGRMFQIEMLKENNSWKIDYFEND